jgi:hypothetical protein
MKTGSIAKAILYGWRPLLLISILFTVFFFIGLVRKNDPVSYILENPEAVTFFIFLFLSVMYIMVLFLLQKSSIPMEQSYIPETAKFAGKIQHEGYTVELYSEEQTGLFPGILGPEKQFYGEVIPHTSPEPDVKKIANKVRWQHEDMEEYVESKRAQESMGLNELLK